MEFDSIDYPITPDTNQDIQEKDLGYNVTIVKDSLYSIFLYGGIRMNEKENELKDICDKAFKRNSIYPLMEIPKPDSKCTIEEQLNNLYNKAENAKKEMKLERTNRCKSLYYSGAVLVPIKSYDMIIIKSVL